MLFSMEALLVQSKRALKGKKDNLSYRPYFHSHSSQVIFRPPLVSEIPGGFDTGLPAWTTQPAHPPRKHPRNARDNVILGGTGTRL